jgi:hypothetical protein
LKVRTSIQPTSAPTGTDEDMGGNDKADALHCGWLETARGETGLKAVSATF